MESLSIKLLDWMWAIVATLMGVVWKLHDTRIDTMKQDIDERMNQFQQRTSTRIDELSTETNRNRDVAAKIFEKLDHMSRESADRHERLLTALHAGLDRKVDK